MKENIRISIGEFGPRFTVRLSALTDGAVRVALALLGHFTMGKKKFAITRQTLAEVVRNFRARPADTVIDYEHASEFPERAQGQPIPAAGWIVAVEDAPDADGILWGTVKFTPRAAALLAGDPPEYQYFSPVIDYGAKDKVTGKPQGATLVSAALTNRPFLEGLPAIAMSDWQQGSAAATREEKERQVKKVILADRVARTVRLVNDDDTETTMTLEGLEAPATVVRLSDVKRTDKGLYDFNGIKTADVLIAGEVLQAMHVQTELDGAVNAGKITPAQRGFYERVALSDLPAFRELIKTLPTQVDLRERGVGGTGEERLDHKVILTSIDQEIVKLRAANPALDYMQGWRLLETTRPDLIKSYNAAAKQGSPTNIGGAR